MCGITGIMRPDQGSVNGSLLEAMTTSLAHRGPDGEGYVLFAPGGKGKPIAVTGHLSKSLRVVPRGYTVGFGHRRLAILDRSPLGHQPMGSEDGRVWITYNGEIYNFLELREELQRHGWEFRSRTDTEVVLNAYQAWGRSCLGRFNGMFAFAIWDSRHDRLFCARDRLGMKPFYYRMGAGSVAFASEIKALLKDSSQPVSANDETIHDFLAFGLQDHSADTFFSGIQQLPPGHYLTVEGGRLDLGKWWDLVSSESATELDGQLNDRNAAESFRALFEDAVRLHLRSDVTVGSCLSGGLDSSSIVCTMSKLLASGEGRNDQRSERFTLKTFSSCFEDPTCDERPYLRAVVAQADSESVEVFPNGRRLFAELPRITWFQDEPFGGTSYLAQWAVMRAASEHGVHVLLDGQGGDELLCGYPGYWGSHLADLLRAGRLATWFREGWAYGSQQARVHPTVLANFARALLPRSVVSGARSRMKRTGVWIAPEFASRYKDRSQQLVYEARSSSALVNHEAAYLKTHSLPALLHHEDRNAMAFSIEARLPFLDARLVEFLMRLPPGQKLRNGRSKEILRQSMAGLLPEVVRTRSDKMGFVTPEDRWLRESLREDLEELFASKPFEQRGYWDAAQIKSAYQAYCENRCSIGSSVWRWVSIEYWFRQFIHV